MTTPTQPPLAKRRRRNARATAQQPHVPTALPVPLPPPPTSSTMTVQASLPQPVEQVPVPVPQPVSQEDYKHALTPESRETLRSVLRTLNLDPRTLTRLANITVSPGTPPPIKPAQQLLRKIVSALAALIHPSDPQALTALFEASTGLTPQDKLTANVITAMGVTRRGTLARRYVRSVLCGSMSRGEVNQLLGHTGPAPEEGDSDGEDEKGGLRITGKTFSRARRDWDMLLACGELTPAKYGRSKVQDDSLRTMLRFLYSPENIVLASWGGLRTVVDGRALALPAVMVAKNGSVLHQEYAKLLESRGETPLSRGSFYAVLNTLTRRDMTRPLPVDNATRTLVKDPLTLVRDLIIRLVPYGDRSQFLKEVDKVEWFLTWSFAESHLGADSIGFHDVNFALKSSALLDDLRAISSRTVDCKGCVFPFSVIGEILQMANLQERSAVGEVAKICRDKFIFYMEYLCRKGAQDKALENAITEIVSKKMYNRVVVFMDYLHSSSAERMGKAHVVPSLENAGFHGSVVYFLDQPTEGNSKAGELKTLFYEHLVSTNLDEDPAVIAFVTEAFLRRLRADFPHVDEIIFVTDNTPLYKNQFVPAFLPHMARHQGVRAVRLIHTCSQICEFLIDALFESVMSKLKCSCNDMATLTPASVTDIINAASGGLRIAAELLIIDAEAVEFVKRLEVLQEHRSAFPDFGNANDIVYQDWQASDAGPRNVVKARAYDFASIGNGSAVEIDDHICCGLQQQTVPGPTQPTEASARLSTQQSVLAGGQAPTEMRFPTAINGELQTAIAASAALLTSDPVRTAQMALDLQQATRAPQQWKGKVTGVRVLSTDKMKRPRREGLIPSPGRVSGGLIADTIAQMRSADTSKEVKPEKDAREDLIGVHVVKTGIVGRSCSECNRSFKSERFLNSHSCKGPPADKDISARAVVLAEEMVRNGDLPVFCDSAEHLWKDSILNENAEAATIAGLEYGWATATRVNLVESNTTLQYKKEVFGFLDERKGSEPITAAVIHSRLLAMHPGTDNLPSLETIEGWCKLRKAAWRIQPFCQIGIDGTPVLTYEEETETGPGKSRMKNRYAAKITEMHEQQMQLAESERPKPRHMFKDFEDFFKDEQGRTPPDFPEMKQVMNKINALRSKSKRAEVR